LYATSVSVLTNAWSVSRAEHRIAKYSWRSGAQPRVARAPVIVPSGCSRIDDHSTLPG